MFARVYLKAHVLLVLVFLELAVRPGDFRHSGGGCRARPRAHGHHQQLPRDGPVGDGSAIQRPRRPRKPPRQCHIQVGESRGGQRKLMYATGATQLSCRLLASSFSGAPAESRSLK